MRKKVVSLGLISLLSLTVLIGCGEKAPDSEELSKEEEVIKPTQGKPVEEKPVEEKPRDYVPVSIEKIKLRDISESTTFSGKIVPNSEVILVPKMPGKVDSLSVEVGDTVSSGQTIFTLDDSDIQSRINQAKQALSSAQSALDQAKEQKKQAENTPGVPPGSAPSLAGVESQVDQAQMAYDQAREGLEDVKITSPVSGVVSQVNINEGGLATNAQPSVVILDISDMFVEIDIPEKIVSQISEGQDVNIDISVVNKMSEGIIQTISPSPDERTKLYKARILIDELPEEVKTGMFVRASFAINAKEDIIAVKNEVIIEEGEKNYVFLAEDGKAVKTLVELGIESGDYVEIVDGLKKDEELIVKGQDYVDDGSKLKVIRGEK